METKKSLRSDLEKRRGVLTYLSLAISVGVVFTAFSYTTTIKKPEPFVSLDLDEIVEILTPITAPLPELTLPPPPLPLPPPVIEMIEIIDDNSDIDDDIELYLDDDVDVNPYVYDDVIIEIEPIEEEIEESDSEVEWIIHIIEDRAEFPGGSEALHQFLSESLEYPRIAADNDVSGRVRVQFRIAKDGRVDRAKVMRPVNPSLDKEALRVVNSMPRWTPKKVGGEPVDSYYQVPINFQLPNGY